MENKYSHLRQNIWEAKKKELIELLESQKKEAIYDKKIKEFYKYSNELNEELNEEFYSKKGIAELYEKKEELKANESKISDLSQVYFNINGNIHELSGKTIDNLNDLILRINEEMDLQILGGKNE